MAGNIGGRGGERGVSAWRQGCGGRGDVRGDGTEERWQRKLRKGARGYG